MLLGGTTRVIPTEESFGNITAVDYNTGRSLGKSRGSSL
jgi:hypothetical protein